MSLICFDFHFNVENEKKSAKYVCHFYLAFDEFRSNRTDTDTASEKDSVENFAVN